MIKLAHILIDRTANFLDIGVDCARMVLNSELFV